MTESTTEPKSALDLYADIRAAQSALFERITTFATESVELIDALVATDEYTALADLLSLVPPDNEVYKTLADLKAVFTHARTVLRARANTPATTQGVPASPQFMGGAGAMTPTPTA